MDIKCINPKVNLMYGKNDKDFGFEKLKDIINNRKTLTLYCRNKT